MVILMSRQVLINVSPGVGRAISIFEFPSFADVLDKHFLALVKASSVPKDILLRGGIGICVTFTGNWRRNDVGGRRVSGKGCLE
jgi:hypothetical protein